MLRLIILIVTTTLLALQSTAQNKELVSAIKQYAYPITTPNPIGPDNDLVFLENLLKDKSIIALGESTHGTKEFFQMKHRLLKYMVQNMGYRLFAIEANQPECEAINDYVLYGIGDPQQALRGIYFWTWNTIEVLDMIKWMRTFNEGKPDTQKVHFLGFDMQTGMVAAKKIKAQLDKHQVDYRKFKIVLDSVASTKRYLYSLNKTTKADILQQVQDLYSFAQSYKMEFVNTSGEIEYQSHLQHLSILVQAIENAQSGPHYRDSCMAANIKWITDFYGTEKIVIWAHNAHINKSKVAANYGYYSMGYWLKKIYGDKYYSIGFDFNTGSFRARRARYADNDLASRYEVVTFTINNTLKNSTDYYFKKTDIPIFLLDYTMVSQNNLLRDFLSNEIKTKSIGALYWEKWEKSYYRKQKLIDIYDATLYFDKTTSAVGLNTIRADRNIE
ncbi:MAG TPA: erythromycin esterase family protein [Flavipsychrobacter sp.]